MDIGVANVHDIHVMNCTCSVRGPDDLTTQDRGSPTGRYGSGHDSEPNCRRTVNGSPPPSVFGHSRGSGAGPHVVLCTPASHQCAEISGYRGTACVPDECTFGVWAGAQDSLMARTLSGCRCLSASSAESRSPSIATCMYLQTWLHEAHRGGNHAFREASCRRQLLVACMNTKLALRR